MVLWGPVSKPAGHWCWPDGEVLWGGGLFAESYPLELQDGASKVPLLTRTLGTMVRSTMNKYLLEVPGSHTDQMTQGGNKVLRLGVCVLGWGWSRFTPVQESMVTKTVNLIGIQHA